MTRAKNIFVGDDAFVFASTIRSGSLDCRLLPRRRHSRQRTRAPCAQAKDTGRRWFRMSKEEREESRLSPATQMATPCPKPERAEHEDVVLGEVVMAAVRRLAPEDDKAPRAGHRRRGQLAAPNGPDSSPRGRGASWPRSCTRNYAIGANPWCPGALPRRLSPIALSCRGRRPGWSLMPAARIAAGRTKRWCRPGSSAVAGAARAGPLLHRARPAGRQAPAAHRILRSRRPAGPSQDRPDLSKVRTGLRDVRFRRVEGGPGPSQDLVVAVPLCGCVAEDRARQSGGGSVGRVDLGAQVAEERLPLAWLAAVSRDEAFADVASNLGST